MLSVLDIVTWIEQTGLLTALVFIGLLVFAESGLLIGVFLPGDTLLLAAGLLAAQGHLPLWPVMLIIFIGAVAGDNTGYWFGRKTGPRLFRKKDGIFFRREHAVRAEKFFHAYGSLTVLIARFIPYVRTFTPIVAGVARMPRPLFMAYNVIGALLWTVTTVMIGYWFGSKIPNVERYMLPAVAAAALIIIGPTIWHVLSNRRSRRQVFAKLDTKHTKRRYYR